MLMIGLGPGAYAISNKSMVVRATGKGLARRGTLDHLSPVSMYRNCTNSLIGRA